MQKFGFYIDVISHCNLRCPSCLIGNKYGNHAEWPRGLMSTELLGRILDKAQHECEVAWVGLFNWTEPLIHPNIAELVRTTKARNIAVSISSNLNVLRDPDSLLAAAPDYFRISLSGFTQDIYERGHREGYIEQVKQNMIELAAAKQRTRSSTHINVFYHRYAYNEHEIEPMRSFATSLGFDLIAFAAQIFPVEKIIDIAGGKMNDADRAVVNSFTYSFAEALGMPSDKCSLLDDQIVIDVDGNVNLCCASSLDRKNSIGKFLELPISEIQRRRHEHKLCNECFALGVPDYLTTAH